VLKSFVNVPPRTAVPENEVSNPTEQKIRSTKLEIRNKSKMRSGDDQNRTSKADFEYLNLRLFEFVLAGIPTSEFAS
jgi:hypothetical protein